MQYITFTLSEAEDRKGVMESYQITYKGLQYAVKLNTEGDDLINVLLQWHFVKKHYM